MVFLDEQRYILYMSTVSENLRKQFARFQASEADKGNFVDQKDLAALLGLTPGFVSHLMTGKNPLSLTRALQLATIFGCSVADLSPQLGEELAANAKGINLQDQTAYKTVGLIVGDVVDFFNTIKEGKAVKLDEFMHWPFPHSNATYAVTVTDKRMEPVIPAGSIAIIDTELQEQAGKVSALLINGQFLLAESLGNGVFQISNDAFPVKSYELGDDDLHLGRMIGQQVAH